MSDSSELTIINVSFWVDLWDTLGKNPGFNEWILSTDCAIIQEGALAAMLADLVIQEGDVLPPWILRNHVRTLAHIIQHSLRGDWEWNSVQPATSELLTVWTEWEEITFDLTQRIQGLGLSIHVGMENRQN